MVRLIPAEAIDAVLPLTDSIEAIERAHREIAAGRATTNFMETIDSSVRAPPDEAVDPVRHELRTHSGVVEGRAIGSVRVNSDIVNWPDHGRGLVRDKIPAIDGEYTGFILLFSTDTGEPLAIVPDAHIQRTRTAITSALGARELAISNPRVLGLLGAGWQARSHLPVYDHLFDLDVVRVYALTGTEREAFVSEMADRIDADIEAVASPETVFDGADVVKCVTNASSEPVFEVGWIEPGTHVGLNRIEEAPDEFFSPETLAAFGTTFPPTTQHELYGQEYRKHHKRRKVWNTYVTETAQPVPRLERAARMESPHQWEDEVQSLSRLLTDEGAGRPTKTAVTGFNTTSVGVDFTVLANIVYEAAEDRDIGIEVPTGLFTQQGHP